MSLKNEGSKQVQESVAAEIYGPYPKDNPQGVYKTSFFNVFSEDREEVWVKTFADLVEELRKRIG